MKTSKPNARQISEWFHEWAANTHSAAKMPTPQQCQPIAEILNPAVPFGFDFWEIGQELLNDPFLKAYKNREIELKADCRTLKASLSKTITLLRKHGIPDHKIPEALLRLEESLDSAIKKLGSRPRGRPRSREDLGFAARLGRCCKEALIESGFRRNASMMSDHGPASFVVAKCLNQIDGTNVLPRTIARHIRNEMAFYQNP